MRYQLGCVVTGLALCVPVPLTAQMDVAGEPSVQLDFTPQLELKLLVDYVSQRLELGILYDEQIANKRITIRAPREVPVSSLLGLLRSALRMHDLALVDVAGSPWKQIVPGAQLPAAAALGDARKTAQVEGPSAPVTQVFSLTKIDAALASQLVRPFLSPAVGPGAQVAAALPGGAVPPGKAIQVSGQNLLIVTDYASNVAKVARLIDLLNRVGSEAVVEFVPLKHAATAELAKQLDAVVKKQSNTGQGTRVDHDDRTNRLILAGRREDIQEMKELIRSLDVPSGDTTRAYSLQFASAEQTDQIMQELLRTSEGENAFRSGVDTDNNQLVVTARPDVHGRIESLLRQLDVAPTEDQNPIRIFRLENVAAWQVLTTLSSLQGDDAMGGPGGSVPGGFGGYAPDNFGRYDVYQSGPGIGGPARGFGGGEFQSSGPRSGLGGSLRTGGGFSTSTPSTPSRRLGAGQFGN